MPLPQSLVQLTKNGARMPVWLIEHSQVYFSVVDATAPNGDQWTATRNTRDGGVDWWQTGIHPHNATRTPNVPAAVKAHVESLLDAVANLPYESRAAFCAEHRTENLPVTP